jgi:excisionase family DNA binding protein
MGRLLPDSHLGEIVAAFEQAVASAAPDSLPVLLGTLERLKALAWARAADAAGGGPVPRPTADPVGELRHLTPLQVAELVNLKEAYVHELCRSGRIPATKEGKYWIIPVTGLREWLGRSRHRVDPDAPHPLPSANTTGSRAVRSAKVLGPKPVSRSLVVRRRERPDSRRTEARNDRSARQVATVAMDNIREMKPSRSLEATAASPAATGVGPVSS